MTAATSPEQFAAWGWRVPFLLSGLLLVVGIVIRRRLSESPSFQRLKQSGRREALPIGAIIGHRKRLTALVIGSQAAENTSFHVFAVWALAYLTTTIGVPRPVVLSALMVAAAACLVAQPFFGALSDRIGRKRVFAGGMAFTGLFIVPFFLMIGPAARSSSPWPWSAASSSAGDHAGGTAEPLRGAVRGPDPV